jgi:hypothetical protein
MRPAVNDLPLIRFLVIRSIGSRLNELRMALPRLKRGDRGANLGDHRFMSQRHPIIRRDEHRIVKPSEHLVQELRVLAVLKAELLSREGMSPALSELRGEARGVKTCVYDENAICGQESSSG